MAWAWVVARQLLLLFESDPLVARAALGCDHLSGAEADAALAEALLAGARVALERLGKGGDKTKRILGGGVVRAGYPTPEGGGRRVREGEGGQRQGAVQSGTHDAQIALRLPRLLSLAPRPGLTTAAGQPLPDAPQAHRLLSRRVGHERYQPLDARWAAAAGAPPGQADGDGDAPCGARPHQGRRAIHRRLDQVTSPG